MSHTSFLHGAQSLIVQKMHYNKEFEIFLFEHAIRSDQPGGLIKLAGVHAKTFPMKRCSSLTGC